MGSSLILYLGEGQRFDLPIVSDAIVEFGGMRCARPEGDTTQEFDYDVGDSFTAIRFLRDGESIAIDGEGPAALDAAIKIQRAYPQPIKLIDQGYSFELQLTDYHSAHELDCAITDAYW
jgi:hypothetical protein